MRTKVAALCTLGLLAVSAVHAEEWKLAKDEDGIKVYLSEVPGSRYKAYRGITTIKADIATLRALQEDVAGSCAWIHECREQKLLKLEGPQCWTYTRFNTPWPVTPRDSVLRVTSQLGADGSVTRILEGVPDYLPEAKGYVRVTQVGGLWKLVPKGGGGGRGDLSAAHRAGRQRAIVAGEQFRRRRALQYPEGHAQARGEALDRVEIKKAAIGSLFHFAACFSRGFPATRSHAARSRCTAGADGRSCTGWRAFPSSARSSRRYAPGRRSR